jgi:ABC-type transport system involved in cytochrome c biogenesis ATPase subunit
MSENVVLQVEDLGFAYPECEVFKAWSMALPAGLALVRGDESTGKTTLLRLLAGELAPQAGRIVLNAEVLKAAPARNDPCSTHSPTVFWADARAGHWDPLVAQAWLGSLPAQYPQWDVAALADHIEGFALQEHLHKPFYALSTGSRRKVLMAAALASGAPLTLIDEPVGGLDKPSARYLADALARAVGAPGPRSRLVVVAHYEALPGVAWDAVVDLPPR